MSCVWLDDDDGGGRDDDVEKEPHCENSKKDINK